MKIKEIIKLANSVKKNAEPIEIKSLTDIQLKVLTAKLTRFIVDSKGIRFPGESKKIIKFI